MADCKSKNSCRGRQAGGRQQGGVRHVCSSHRPRLGAPTAARGGAAPSDGSADPRRHWRRRGRCATRLKAPSPAKTVWRRACAYARLTLVHFFVHLYSFPPLLVPQLFLSLLYRRPSKSCRTLRSGGSENAGVRPPPRTGGHSAGRSGASRPLWRQVDCGAVAEGQAGAGGWRRPAARRASRAAGREAAAAPLSGCSPYTLAPAGKRRG